MSYACRLPKKEYPFAGDQACRPVALRHQAARVNRVDEPKPRVKSGRCEEFKHEGGRTKRSASDLVVTKNKTDVSSRLNYAIEFLNGGSHFDEISSSNVCAQGIPLANPLEGRICTRNSCQTQFSVRLLSK